MAAILVLYHSQEHGNTGAMAEAIAEGVRDSGADATLVNTNDKRMDPAEYAAFDAAAFGSPDYYSYLAGGLKMFLDDWHIAKGRGLEGVTDKPYGLFYSHGGGGRVVEPMQKLFARLGTQVGQSIESCGKPDEKTLAACRELGQQLAEAADKD